MIKWSLVFDTPRAIDLGPIRMSILIRRYSPVDLTGNVNMIENFVLGGTGTGDLPILSPKH